MSHRTQCTYANGITSTYANIICGVPQGSILGPLFFIIYIDDISNIIRNCKHSLFADDTVLYMTGNTKQCTTMLQQDLKSFKVWCDRNQLTMNIKKMKYVTFGLKSQTRKFSEHQLFFNDRKIERVVSYKYLGITLDVNLNFNKHIENCLKLISHKAYLLIKSEDILMYTAITIYKTMILPIIGYGDILYDGSNQNLLKDFQTAQNRILRICTNLARQTSTHQLHVISKLNVLKDRRLVHLNLFMYKQTNNVDIVNNRNVRTRAHDAPLFKTIKPNN